MKCNKKKWMLCVLLPIFVIAAGVLLFLALLPGDYAIDREEWEITPYTVVKYDKDLGSSWDGQYGVTSYYSAVKGVDKDEWIYEGRQYFLSNLNPFSWTVYRKKGVTIEPIRDWTVKELLIVGIYHQEERGRISYSVDGKVTDRGVISALTDAVNGEPQRCPDGFSYRTDVLFVFEEAPGLALVATIKRSKDGAYYLSVGDRDFPADVIAQCDAFTGKMEN